MSLPGNMVWLLSRDPGFVERIQPLIESTFQLHVFNDYSDYRRSLDLQGMSLCLIDLRLGDEGPEPEEISLDLQDHVLLLLGTPGHSQLQGLSVKTVYAILRVEITPTHLLHTLQQAQTHLELREENQRLRHRLSQPAPSPIRATQPLEHPLFSSKEYIRFFRLIQQPEQLKHLLIQDVCSQLMLSRAGLYLYQPDNEQYVLETGHMLFPGLRSGVFPADSPLVRWLERHAHVVSRTNLSSTVSPEDERLLRRVLNQWGAEILIPLRGQNGLLGWMFAGKSLLGQAFDEEEIHHLIEACDLMSAALENSIEHLQARESLFHASSMLREMHFGLIQASPQGTVLWASPSARKQLELTAPELPERLHPELTRLIQQAGEAQTEQSSEQEWRHPQSGRLFHLHAQRIEPLHHPPCVLLTLEDRTQEQARVQRRQEGEQQRLWQEMSDGLSHEIRNPLVTLKTFTQLLPEQMEDPRFRAVFEEQVEKEIGKLQQLVEQVQSFARPPAFTREPIQLRELLEEISRTFKKELSSYSSNPTFNLILQPETPAFSGDPHQLTTALLHLLQNAAEASLPSGARIELEARHTAEHLILEVRDNGKGCPPGQKEALFSPFISSKAKGLGLGLPIARRVARNHEGELHLESNQRGTRVTLTLPHPPPAYEKTSSR